MPWGSLFSMVKNHHLMKYIPITMQVKQTYKSFASSGAKHQLSAHPFFMARQCRGLSKVEKGCKSPPRGLHRRAPTSHPLEKGKEVLRDAAHPLKKGSGGWDKHKIPENWGFPTTHPEPTCHRKTNSGWEGMQT